MRWLALIAVAACGGGSPRAVEPVEASAHSEEIIPDEELEPARTPDDARRWYVLVDEVTGFGTVANAVLPVVRAAVTKGLGGVAQIQLDWPTGLPPTQRELDDAGVIGIDADVNVVKLAASGKQHRVEIRCTVEIVLATFPGQQLIASMTGSAATSAVPGATSVAQGEAECVEAVTERLAQEKVPAALRQR